MSYSLDCTYSGSNTRCVVNLDSNYRKCISLISESDAVLPKCKTYCRCKKLSFEQFNNLNTRGKKQRLKKTNVVIAQKHFSSLLKSCARLFVFLKIKPLIEENVSLNNVSSQTSIDLKKGVFKIYFGLSDQPMEALINRKKLLLNALDDLQITVKRCLLKKTHGKPVEI